LVWEVEVGCAGGGKAVDAMAVAVVGRQGWLDGDWVEVKGWVVDCGCGQGKNVVCRVAPAPRRGVAASRRC